VADNALTYGHVVPVKGGSHLFFWSWGVDRLCRKFGIPTFMQVPGMSLPFLLIKSFVDQRGVSKSFWVVQILQHPIENCQMMWL
jgi:hypothetical protein